MKHYWPIYCIFIAFLFGSCSALAAGASHWPSFLIAMAIAICLKLWSDRKNKFQFPEVLFFTVVILIVVNLVWLYFTEAPMPY